MKKNMLYLSIALLYTTTTSTANGSFTKPSVKKLKEEYAQQLVDAIKLIPQKQVELAEEQVLLVHEQHALAKKQAELIKMLDEIMNDEKTYTRAQLAQLTEQTKNFNTRLAQLDLHHQSNTKETKTTTAA